VARPCEHVMKCEYCVGTDSLMLYAILEMRVPICYEELTNKKIYWH
jgi:hypothetical protein